MLRPVVALALATWLAGVHAPAAQAQTVCGERVNIIEGLRDRYAEVPRAIGVTADGAVIEILASSSGTWTILITYPNRMTCFVAAGEAWETLPVLATGRPA